MDQDSFRSFYNKTMPVLRAYVLRRSGSVDVVDDIVQDAFLRFLRSAPATLNEPQMRSYLYRTAENLIVNRWHGIQREQGAPEKSVRQLAGNPAVDMTRDMERAFSQLEPRQQTLLWLAYVEGFDHREIAAAASVSEKSVRVLLFRARQKLLGILKNAGFNRENA